MNQKNVLLFGGGLLLLAACKLDVTEAPKPNILICIADDITWKHMGAYGCDWVQTPNFDRVANEGILFNNAFTSNAKCSPSRASIMTGLNTWQLEEACNHMCFFREKFKTYPEVLQENGYFVGFTGKGYVPAKVDSIDGKPRKVLGIPYKNKFLTPPTTEISAEDYFENFREFLNDKPADDPFCFWYGGHEPHRAYEYRSSLEKGGYSLDVDIDIPAFWPQNDVVKTDMLDYAYEIAWFDLHLGKMLNLLEEKGELDNTLVIVTADNGMPFPRVKGQGYEYSNHLPLAIMWPKGIKHTGRVVDDFINFADFAPTILDLAGVNILECGMQEIEGKSFKGILFSKKEGMVDEARNHMLIGKERHDVGRPDDQGYPIRGIRTDRYLYIKNYEPSRWPSGNPETGYLNTDGSPTKTAILTSRIEETPLSYWDLNFGKRASEELYDITKDPDCINNLAGNQVFAELKEMLKSQMEEGLRAQGDPRMFGKGHVFDSYEVCFPNLKDFYNRFMAGEKLNANWVNETDFDTIVE